MELETLAMQGRITFAHDKSRSIHDSDAYDITVTGDAGALIIGTTAHASEMPELVGPVVAQSLADLVASGRYVYTMNRMEVMGLRGVLADRLARTTWAPFVEPRQEEQAARA